MTNERALDHLSRRADYLDRRVGELSREGRPSDGLKRDIEANAQAIAALEYTIQMLAWEAEQKSR